MRDSATIHQGLATLTSVEDPQGTAFRLRVRAPDGHVVYDAVPAAAGRAARQRCRGRLSRPRARVAEGCRAPAVSALSKVLATGGDAG